MFYGGVYDVGLVFKGGNLEQGEYGDGDIVLEFGVDLGKEDCVYGCVDIKDDEYQQSDVVYVWNGFEQGVD